ncbi:MAG: hypothetical protein P4K97_09475 [Terracidiphilus sp.]|nr:hypothetical protein [Terracidiphilus sp.]
MHIRLLIASLLASACLPLHAAAPQPPAHDQFRVAVYIPVAVVERMKDAAWLQQSWEQIDSQVKVDKVYIESYRSGVFADDALLEAVKTFFTAHGVQVAGGIAYAAGGDTAGSESGGGDGQFVSFSYTDPKQRAYVKQIAEHTARHFDEIILDDFFFNNTKRDSDIAAKGQTSWSQFRLRLMDDVSRNLVLGPARAVNPKVKVVIKFPNWYEHFQANGYDLDQEPKIFDGIYTGTETRDPVITDQHLQQYESYQIVRYFDNIKPGGNGGGWVDTYDTRYIDRYAEQLWDTMLAKAPEIMLFQWSDLLKPAQPGNREAWSGLHTSFDYAGMTQWHQASGAASEANLATVAGYSLAKVNSVVGKLGTPIGIASYKPYQSTGEDFLHNYLGMIGIPIDLHPEFPTEAKTVLLTESAKFDPALVGKIKAHLEKGGNVVLTSGLLRALNAASPNQISQIADLRFTGSILKVTDYWGAFGAGGGVSLGATNEILIPEIGFQTNDAWPIVRGTASGRGAPLLLLDRYSKGILYVLTIPENPSDLYALPQPVLASIRQYLLAGFPVQIDAPSKVSLFAYDNKTFVVESYLDAPAQVTVTALGTFSKLRNLTSGDTVEGKPSAAKRHGSTASQTEFHIQLAPHSFAAFAQE